MDAFFFFLGELFTGNSKIFSGTNGPVEGETKFAIARY
jgi:hypothetical protein